MKNKNMRVSQHALYRYMERILKFDFTELRLNFMIERGLPSLNYIKDGEFVAWLEFEIKGMDVFRNKIVEHVWDLMSWKQQNIAINNKNFEARVKCLDNGVVFVVCDNVIVTVLN